jgi:hypothetical protein
MYPPPPTPWGHYPRVEQYIYHGYPLVSRLLSIFIIIALVMSSPTSNSSHGLCHVLQMSNISHSLDHAPPTEK